MENSRLARPDRKARLCDISWIDRNRFWLAVAPNTYATAQNFSDQKGVFRSRYASTTWRETTPKTTYLVKGSGPQSLVTCAERSVSNAAFSDDACGWMDANLWVCLDNREPPRPMWFLGVGPEEVVLFRLDGFPLGRRHGVCIAFRARPVPVPLRCRTGHCGRRGSHTDGWRSCSLPCCRAGHGMSASQRDLKSILAFRG